MFVGDGIEEIKMLKQKWDDLCRKRWNVFIVELIKWEGV